jgi:Na+/H+ antiporter NhaC
MQLKEQLVGYGGAILLIGLLALLFICQKKQTEMAERNETFIDVENTAESIIGLIAVIIIFIIIIIFILFLFGVNVLAILGTHTIDIFEFLYKAIVD